MADIAVPGDGFEKLIVGLANGLAKTENAVMSVVYGSNDPLGGVKFPGNAAKTRGLIPILREINKIDLCNVINYALGNISLFGGSIGEKVKKVNELARKLNDLLELDFIDPSKAKQPDKVALLVAAIVELDTLLDPEIISIVPKLQPYKTNLNNLVNLLIQYGAAAKSYEVINKSVEAALKENPDGTKIDKTSSSATIVVSVENKNSGKTTELEVPYETINNLGKTINSSGRYVIQQVDLTQIPIAEVQQLLKHIREIKEVLNFIISITSVGDLASALIPNEIKELQKIVNPAKLLPVIRTILNYTRSVNQVAQQVLGFASVARTIVKVITFIIKAFQIIVLIFRFLAYPLMYATFSISNAFSEAKEAAAKQVESALKRVSQLGKVIDIVYGFANSVSSILQELIVLLETLIFNLESCNPSAIVGELKDVKAKVQDSLRNLQELTRSYDEAKLASNQAVYNGYILKIEEEEVEESSITAKRRRAIAYDYSNIMVTATDLTFATDKNLLFEELRLKLVNEGLTQDTGNAFNTDLSTLNAIFNPNTLPETTGDMYASLGITPANGQTPEEMMKGQVNAVQTQINKVISSIKGGDDLKKLTKSEVSTKSQQLKQGINSGEVDLLSNPQTTTTVNTVKEPTKLASQESVNPDILSDNEVKRLQNLITSVDNSPNARGLVNTNQYITAKDKLKRNADARKAAGM